VFGLCVGWPDPERPAAPKPRLPQRAVLHDEAYTAEGEEASVEGYNRAMAAFYQEQGMPVDTDWAQHSARRVAGPQTLSGRHALRAALKQLGFELQ
jgi:hypothetical protein